MKKITTLVLGLGLMTSSVLFAGSMSDDKMMTESMKKSDKMMKDDKMMHDGMNKSDKMMKTGMKSDMMKDKKMMHDDMMKKNDMKSKM